MSAMDGDGFDGEREKKSKKKVTLQDAFASLRVHERPASHAPHDMSASLSSRAYKCTHIRTHRFSEKGVKKVKKVEEVEKGPVRRAARAALVVRWTEAVTGKRAAGVGHGDGLP